MRFFLVVRLVMVFLDFFVGGFFIMVFHNGVCFCGFFSGEVYFGQLLG